MVDREMPDSDGSYLSRVVYLEAPFSLCILGHDNREQSHTEYWYTMTFTPREMKILLSRYLRTERMPGIEKKLWVMLLDLWEKRLKRRGRKTKLDKTFN